MALVKIMFDCPQDGLGGGAPEILWAKKLTGDNKGLYEIHNSPFYAKGVSYLDIVKAEKKEGFNDILCYKYTVKTSNHSTFRILLFKTLPIFNIWWKKLSEINCTYEFSDANKHRLYTIDVPVAKNIDAAIRIFKDGEQEEVWEYEEGHVCRN